MLYPCPPSWDLSGLSIALDSIPPTETKVYHLHPAQSRNMGCRHIPKSQDWYAACLWLSLGCAEGSFWGCSERGKQMMPSPCQCSSRRERKWWAGRLDGGVELERRWNSKTGWRGWWQAASGKKKTVELELELMSWAGTSTHRGRNGMKEIKHYQYLSFHLLQRTMANHVVSSPLVFCSTLGKKDLCTQLPQVLCPPPNISTYLILFHLKTLVRDKSVSLFGFRWHNDTKHVSPTCLLPHVYGWGIHP